MVSPSAGSVVLIPFPFSDLSRSKLRPAVVLAFAERDDWILCQITSKPYSDVRAVEISDSDFSEGSLHLVSYVRPGKLFTAHKDLFKQEIGCLTGSALSGIIESVISVLKNNA